MAGAGPYTEKDAEEGLDGMDTMPVRRNERRIDVDSRNESEPVKLNESWSATVDHEAEGALAVGGEGGASDTHNPRISEAEATHIELPNVIPMAVNKIHTQLAGQAEQRHELTGLQ
ncbi:hypothetical protein NP233_g6924 [Leucocoprinus birnbaumii]|uniref:Uncharacterized protein n=1 Tax=Leucocoprinus birnbaumii TaxID=56174 RepID=A0AAD5VQ97_9AGAR|nr:hypothetical protein NP233_g6924 [Leucocoprinus birnbaumii]